MLGKVEGALMTVDAREICMLVTERADLNGSFQERKRLIIMQIHLFLKVCIKTTQI